jgi:hypothetical protein
MIALHGDHQVSCSLLHLHKYHEVMELVLLAKSRRLAAPQLAGWTRAYTTRVYLQVEYMYMAYGCADLRHKNSPGQAHTITRPGDGTQGLGTCQ